MIFPLSFSSPVLFSFLFCSISANANETQISRESHLRSTFAFTASGSQYDADGSQKDARLDAARKKKISIEIFCNSSWSLMLF